MNHRWIVEVKIDRPEDLARLLGFLGKFPELQFTIEATEKQERTELTPLDPDELPYYWGEVGC